MSNFPAIHQALPISRRRLLMGATAAAVSAPLGLAALSPAPGLPRLGHRRHTLLLIIDDLAELITEPAVSTPHLERLAARSAWYGEAHAAVAMCAPSRAAALTGTSPAVSGMTGNHNAYFGDGRCSAACDGWSDRAERPQSIAWWPRPGSADGTYEPWSSSRSPRGSASMTETGTRWVARTSSEAGLDPHEEGHHHLVDRLLHDRIQ